MTTPWPGRAFTSAAEGYGRFRPGVPAEAVPLLADTVRDVDRSVLPARRPGGGA
ncbi:hypothetical protein ACFYUJ_32250 [Streptomyces sp. NPDC004520]|uniref:hypothetical protein n=1 Tax=Streptomyces sp. NPDC004520 TaxID=3364702 RepID=UPI00368DEE59